jgi:hypothetical protein
MTGANLGSMATAPALRGARAQLSWPAEGVIGIGRPRSGVFTAPRAALVLQVHLQLRLGGLDLREAGLKLRVLF